MGDSAKSGQYSRGMPLLPDTWRWPATCELCAGWPSRPVCDGCRQQWGQVLPRCPGCALALAPGLERCSRCTQEPTAVLHRCLARVDYTYPWTEPVQRFKFQQEPAWAGHLAELMLDDPNVVEALRDADLLAPIPLPTPRLLERGYNQAWELLRQLRRRTPGSAPAVAQLLHRQADGVAIHTLPRTQRFDAAQQAFEVNNRFTDRLADTHVLLVDDVMTTGATLQAAAQVLRSAGAARVSGLVFARTPAPDRMK